jgi:hypothetical protein
MEAGLADAAGLLLPYGGLKQEDEESAVICPCTMAAAAGVIAEDEAAGNAEKRDELTGCCRCSIRLERSCMF